MNIKDFFLRFVFGGMAVMLSYIFSQVIPWKEFGGIFAAFPAVMVVAVIMTGIENGSNKASQIARGAIFGMIGSMVCVISVLFILDTFRNWWISIILGLMIWYSSAVVISKSTILIKHLSTILHGSAIRHISHVFHKH